MQSRSKYKTKQRELLLEFFQAAPGVHITAGDVCDHFKTHEPPIGPSTVYRQLESLVDEGILNKYIIDSGSPACFEYVAPDSHHTHEGESCYHCKCEKCGKLIHLHCNEIREIQSHLMEKHHFQLDPLRTVFYGVCEDCLALAAIKQNEV